MAKAPVIEPFLTDVKTLRERARKSIAKGAVTQNYGGDVKQTIDILQAVLATEIVCVLRYTMHAVSATGISSDSVKEDLSERAGAVSQSAREAADTLKNDIKDAATETFDRVKQAGMDAAKAAEQKVKTP